VAEYGLSIKASAAKEIAALGTKTDRQRVVQRIQQLAVDPRAVGSEKLAGYADRYRVRQGQYRIITSLMTGDAKSQSSRLGIEKMCTDKPSNNAPLPGACGASRLRRTWGQYIHSDIRIHLDKLSLVFADNAYHRVHHQHDHRLR
jgi:mRNA-degrading endonuclease RelE of RelBE toxin-antitoxin system